MAEEGNCSKRIGTESDEAVPRTDYIVVIFIARQFAGWIFRHHLDRLIRTSLSLNGKILSHVGTVAEIGHLEWPFLRDWDRLRPSLNSDLPGAFGRFDDRQ